MNTRTLRVAVISDSAAASPSRTVEDERGLPATAEAVVAQLQRTGLRATAVEDLALLVDTPPGDLGLGGYDAAYLVGPGRARLEQRLPDLGLPVVTQAQAHAVALVAELLLRFQQTRLPRSSSRVLVLGDAHNREVGDLVCAVGVGEVVRWNLDDAVSHPLSVLARRVDVVLDVAGSPEQRREATALVLPPALIALGGPDAVGGCAGRAATRCAGRCLAADHAGAAGG